MTANHFVDMATWMELAVRAVGPIGDRDYSAWLAQVDRVALDLRLRSAAGGPLARQAADIAQGVPVEGVLLEAAPEDAGHGRLVLRVTDPESGATRERTVRTEHTALRSGEEVLRNAERLVGHWVRVRVSDDDAALAMHITGEGRAEPLGAAPGDDAPAPREAGAEEPETERPEPEAEAAREPETREPPEHEPEPEPQAEAEAEAREAEPEPRPEPEPGRPEPADAPPVPPAAASDDDPTTHLAPEAAADPSSSSHTVRLDSRAFREAAAAKRQERAAQAPPPPAAPPAAEIDPPLSRPAPSAPLEAVPWEDGSVVVWKNINRNWHRDYRTSCLLAIRDRAILDAGGRVLNLDELIEMARQSPEPDTPRGRDIAARYAV